MVVPKQTVIAKNKAGVSFISLAYFTFIIFCLLAIRFTATTVTESDHFVGRIVGMLYDRYTQILGPISSILARLSRTAVGELDVINILNISGNSAEFDV